MKIDLTDAIGNSGVAVRTGFNSGPFVKYPAGAVAVLLAGMAIVLT
ncbi:MAG: hypothetical protein ACLPWS_18465 [Rhodomicrobium sp.]